MSQSNARKDFHLFTPSQFDILERKFFLSVAFPHGTELE